MIAQNLHWRRALLLGCSFAALTMPATAMAQAVDEPAVEDDGVIPDIVVTAQKREEALQDVPLAVTALDANLLDQSGVRDATGLTALVPNVAVRPFNNSIIVATRGISNENTSNLGDPSLAFHVNGVYLARPRSAGALFYDVERVELLRGPQGTLYGRNSTAGALNVITRRPRTSEFEAGFDVSYGNYDTLIARGYLNVPLSDSIALRGSIYRARQDGYAINNRSVPVIPLLAGPPEAVGFPNSVITAANTANATVTPTIRNGDDDNEIAGRLSLLVNPSASLRWVLTVGYQETDEVGQARSITSTPNLRGTGGPFLGQLVLPQAQDPNDPRVYTYNTQPQNYIETWDITSEIDWDLSDSVALTMVTAYRDERSALIIDPAGSANVSTVFANGTAEQISNELRLASTGDGRLQWLLGLYYFDEDQVDDLFVTVAGGGPVNVVAANPYISSASYAAFGQVTYDLTEQLGVTLGGRYSRDERRRFGFTVVAPGITVAPDPLPPGTFYTNDQAWERFNWRVGLDYRVNDDVLVYGSVSTGYRAGGFNASSELAYDPEDITAYEVGVKSDWLDRRLRLNLAGFYYEYEDLQITAPREVAGRIQAFTQNAAEARIWGVELEALIRPSSNLSFDVSLGYLNTEFRDFASIDNLCTTNGLTIPAQFRPGCVTLQRFNPDGTPTIIDPDGPGPAPAGPVFDLQTVNYQGNQLANAPEITLNVGANLTLFDNEAGSLTLRGALRLVGESYLSEYNRPFDRVSSYSQSEARITYRSENEQFLVEAFVQNIENNDTPGSLSLTASGVGLSFLPPRTYGLRIGFDF
jgi:iron complex outermembrane recepter protein